MLVEMVLGGFWDKSKVDSVRLLEKYSDFANVFDKDKADRQLKHSQHNLVIEIEKGKLPLFGPVYDKSLIKLGVFCDYVNIMLAKRFIWPSKSLSRAPVLFVPKKDKRLCLCVDFWSLNAITKKNKHLLLLVQTLFDLLLSALFYTKLDVIDAYYCLCIQKSDEWKMAFCCQYKHFEYQVVSFGLMNTSAVFQTYINQALRECIV